MSNEIKIIVCEVGKLAREDVIENKLEKMQEKVQGYIECFDLDEKTTIVCNDEGKINGLPLNRAIRDEDGKIQEVIAGDFFIAGFDYKSGKVKSLDENQKKDLLEKFYFPEEILLINGEVFASKYEPKTNQNKDKIR